jgi:hypothetical protein
MLAKICYIFWGVAIFSALWSFITFIYDLAEASTGNYLTAFDAMDYFISGLLSSIQYLFYGELYHLLYTRLKPASSSQSVREN